MDTVCIRVGEHIKAQRVRLLDVFLIGPLMVWGGEALRREGRPFAGAVLSASGVATVVYNGRNYMRIRRELEQHQVGVLR